MELAEAAWKRTLKERGWGEINFWPAGRAKVSLNSIGKSFRWGRHLLCVGGCVFAMPIRQIIVVFYLVLFLSFGAASSMFFWQTRQEYNQLRQVELSTQRRLLEAEERLREQERMLHRLRTDPAYVEMKIRQRLGYARPEEFIFRFDQ